MTLGGLLCAALILLQHPVPPGNVVPGADRLLGRDFSLVRGKRVGIVTNASGRLSNGTYLVDTLRSRGVRVVALFGPEHGIRGNAPAGEQVGDSRDSATGIRVFSLYGGRTKPTRSMLRGVDVLVYDIQDVGVRFYTYLSTMTLAMEAAAEAGIPFVVCDRPNPIGFLPVDGPIRDDSLRSFVGWLPIPIVYGLTCGELARMINGERWLAKGIRANLHVVPLSGWTRTMRWDETGLPWIPPSPNIRTPEAAVAYPATCYLEALNVSEGRGTEHPFQTIGAPFLEAAPVWSAMTGLALPGVRWLPAEFTPVSSKYAGETCKGVTLRITEPGSVEPLGIALELLRVLLQAGGNSVTVNESWMNRLMGTPTVLRALRNGVDPDTIRRAWMPDLDHFRTISAKYVIYPLR